MPGTNSSDVSELAAARKRFAEPEAELAIHRRAAELLGMLIPLEYELRTPPAA